METKSELKYIHSLMSDLIKFGEAKHAGLIVLNSAIIIGILSSYNSISHILVKPIVVISIIAFGFSIVLSVLSQFPVTNDTIYKGKELKTVNLFFYKHLAHLTVDQFIKIFNDKDVSLESTKINIDLISQILVLSRIVNNKFILFKIASFFAAFGLGIISLSTVTKYLWQL